MECEFCGEEISGGALACPRCGSPVSKPAADAAPVTPAGTPASPAPGGPGAPADAPLARQEEDFIALAEEMVTASGGTPASDIASAPAVPGAPVPPATAVAEQVVPPGASVAPEAIALDNTLTGGYKGEVSGASVAGAGEQTADDPFGLNITEAAPPVTPEADSGRRINFRNVWNIIVMFVALIVAGAVAYTGLYFGFLREKGPSGKAAAALEEFTGKAVSGDSAGAGLLSVPGAPFGNELSAILRAYDNLGIVTLKEFEVEEKSLTKTGATLEIRKFVVELMTENGTEKINVLDITKPERLRTTVDLVYQDGKWLVSN